MLNILQNFSKSPNIGPLVFAPTQILFYQYTIDGVEDLLPKLLLTMLSTRWKRNVNG
jgi:hypothetical protein